VKSRKQLAGSKEQRAKVKKGDRVLGVRALRFAHSSMDLRPWSSAKADNTL